MRLSSELMSLSQVLSQFCYEYFFGINGGKFPTTKNLNSNLKKKMKNHF